ncbi:aec9 [Escherichia coli EC1845]|nr:receptor protein [Escherichia coli FRIK1985]EIO44922.1 receptor protein [Escherichia coli PA41]EIO97130.1 H repeat-associated protein ydcC [Escherichia coli EC4203]EIP31055.1 H repeat-associated protein ydcC [Escherichia coli EC4013]EIP37623.1 H repeat-associated protein ydcC [Escherichia coli EC4402]EIP84106.1 aec9 [Escherichia coli EC1845]EKJ07676.1 hypothetical protein ECEC1856_0245 [Escherichia coli EC1856]EKJ14209.1 H repeat-associated protein ydcC [Escherichia coli EC1864]EKK59039.
MERAEEIMRGSLLSVDNSRTAEQQNSRTAEQKKEPKNDGQILYQFC